MINLTSEELDIVKKLLKKYIPKAKVAVFGSRLSNKIKPWSDLDLAIMSDMSISDEILGNIKEAFSESDLPFRVDILDWNMTDDYFKKIIHEQHETIQ